MVSWIPTASLIASPLHPDSLSWSKENLLAVASGHLITILNPAMLSGPRGLITLPTDKPFPLGAVQKGDLLNTCLLPSCLSRGTQPCARSISWSPLGLSPNSGCLLSVCTTKGRVKVFCSPHSELCTEWTEVVDISDKLYDYFVKINFAPPPKSVQEIGMFDNATDSGVHQSSQECKPDKRSTKRIKPEGLPVITAREYAFRCALLTSLTCAWSPVLHSVSGCSSDRINCFRDKWSILAVGGKSGHICFFRIHETRLCTSKEANASFQVIFVGHLHAHNSWVTTISWGLCSVGSSKDNLVLASGSSDGSVKVWIGDIDRLLSSSEVNVDCFSLLKEVTPVTSISISSISMVVPETFHDKVVLAVGKGSGSLEAWTCHISSKKFMSAGTFDAHEKVITGLEWAVDGGCLYSCSQDGSVRIWALCGTLLHESSFPANFLRFKGSNNAIRLSDPCFGLALSPGNLMLSLVHTLDSDFLNPMYQARTQKAAIKFFWTGGRQLDASPQKHLHYNICEISGLSDMESVSWESDLLTSLMKYENLDNQLVAWDVLAALLCFKQSSPKFVELILCKWFSSWFPDISPNLPIKDVVLHLLSSLPKLDTRKLHLLDIVCRRLMLIDALPDRWSGLENKLDDKNDCQNEKLWKNLLAKSEMELHERLLAFSFKACLHIASQPSVVHTADSHWFPSGVAQMEQWVAINKKVISDDLKFLVSEIKGLGNRLLSRSEYMMEESCGYCSTSVPFESLEVGFCRGVKSKDGSNKKHKLTRCSTSMQLCNITSSLWVCMCCHRFAERLVPETFFTMTSSPLDTSFIVSDSNLSMEGLKPLCPFCGILLRRSQPDFFLSTSPV